MQKTLAKLALVFGIAAGVSGCANTPFISYKPVNDMDSCSNWNEFKFRIPFMPLLPKFKIPTKPEFNSACREAYAVVLPATLNGGNNPAGTLLTYRSYKAVLNKVAANDDPNYNNAVLSFADYFLKEKGTSFKAMDERLHPKPVAPAAPASAPASEQKPAPIPVCTGEGIMRKCDSRRAPPAAPAASTPESAPAGP